ncbi:MAG: hypothetical protein ACSLFR_06175 [Solirubrobacteraceae bacterium]
MTKRGPGDGVGMQIQAGRQDLRFGGKVQQVLKPGAAYAGPKELRNAKIPQPCEPT